MCCTKILVLRRAPHNGKTWLKKFKRKSHKIWQNWVKYKQDWKSFQSKEGAQIGRENSDNSWLSVDQQQRLGMKPRAQYLSLLWRVRQSGAAVEHNYVILFNELNDVTLLQSYPLAYFFLGVDCKICSKSCSETWTTVLFSFSQKKGTL